MDTVESRETERRMISALATLMRVHFRRDECGDYFIRGKSGNIHTFGATPERGFVVFVTATGARALRNKLLRLVPCAKITQRGDAECCLHLSSLPTVEQAGVLREVLHVRLKRQYVGEELLKRQERMRRLSGGVSSKQAIPGLPAETSGSGAFLDGFGKENVSGARGAIVTAGSVTAVCRPPAGALS